ncbi:hypothetical protein HKX48_000437 [Thoreauomyces humboldtii]|nr:hypothetical protein HKX48_000437 [Thoreauomyces humboldtii]
MRKENVVVLQNLLVTPFGAELMGKLFPNLAGLTDTDWQRALDTEPGKWVPHEFVHPLFRSMMFRETEDGDELESTDGSLPDPDNEAHDDTLQLPWLNIPLHISHPFSDAFLSLIPRAA